MLKAMQLIVDAYVRSKKRAALETLRSNRLKLAIDVKSKTSIFEQVHVLGQIEEDLSFINAGLEKLREMDDAP